MSMAGACQTWSQINVATALMPFMPPQRTCPVSREIVNISFLVSIYSRARVEIPRGVAGVKQMGNSSSCRRGHQRSSERTAR